MRRRTFLSTSAALLASSTLGTASGAGQTTTGQAGPDQPAFGPLGHVGIEEAMDAVVGGETVYVAATTGFVTVDVRDPTDPTVLAERRDILADVPEGPLQGVFDLALDGDRLLVAGPANPDRDVLNGVGIFDVSDPESPERVAVYRTEFPIHNLDAAGGRAYLTGNDGVDNPLVVVDYTGDPTEVGRWSLVDRDDRWREVRSDLRSLHDVVVRDGRAYLAHWDAGTWILDVSDPAAISVVSRVRGRSLDELADESGVAGVLQLPGNDHYVTVDEDAALLAVGEEAWDLSNDDVEGGPGGIELFDISTPTEPERLGFIEPPPTEDAGYGGVWTTAHNFDIVDGRLYSSWYRGGVKVHDVSDPADPVELAHWADRDAAEFFTAKKIAGREFFVGSSVGSQTAGIEGALYMFPTIADGAPALTPPGTATPTPTETPTETPTSTATPAPTTTDGPTTAPAEGTTTDADDTTAADGPGFGLVGTLVALGLGGWYARRGGD